ncbi:RING finger protein 37 [Trichoplax sp. H2]|nr:RING finger protein 37 [Trichoplax sp. H2]|eukprot:RDD41982.1 RING finger protein 37 [Trichoplax sp. H2]
MNFCHHLLVENLTCSQICSDGYEVSNLISDNSHLKARGFLVARFVKPPVEIKFHLIVPIDIECILIDRKVGGQISSGLEIYLGKEVDQLKWAAKAFVLETPSNVVGNCVLAFINEAFIGDKEWQIANSGHNSRCHPNSNFYLRGGRALSDVQYISIKILKTSQSSLAAIRLIQIWGKPSKSCDKEMVKKMQAIRRKMEIGSNTSNITTISQSHETNLQCKLNNDDADTQGKVSVQADDQAPLTSTSQQQLVPNDFLDSITCEMMHLPVLLPSGQNVDRTTLERWIKDQSIKGKTPCDPFTGIPFTETSRPVFNTALKIRLDKYLVNFGHNLSSIGRTVGTIQSNDQEHNPFKTVKSVIANMNRARHKINDVKSTLSSGVTFDAKEYSHNSDNQINPPKCSVDSIGIKRKINGSPIPSKMNLKATEIHYQDNLKRNTTNNDDPSCHLAKIRRSLSQAFSANKVFDSGIQDAKFANGITLSASNIVPNAEGSAIQNLDIISESTYDTSDDSREVLSRQTAAVEKQHLIHTCCECRFDITTFQSIFQLKCCHFICRPCLTNMVKESRGEVLCSLCGSKSSRAVITRVHQDNFTTNFS